jgi:hypothetical protein
MNAEPTQQQKRHAHGRIERLAPEKLSAVMGLLEVMLDPLPTINLRHRGLRGPDQ